MCLKNCAVLDILLKVKTYRFADIAIILREILVEIPKKYINKAVSETTNGESRA
jgi:hypothetical protein